MRVWKNLRSFLGGVHAPETPAPDTAASDVDCAPSDTVEIWQDKAGDWRWRIRAANRRIIAASSEGFRTKFSAERNFRRIAAAFLAAD